MPYSDKQRRRFNAGAARGEPGMKKLAKEANQMAASGKKKTAAKSASGAAGQGMTRAPQPRQRQKGTASKKGQRKRAPGY